MTKGVAVPRTCDFVYYCCIAQTSLNIIILIRVSNKTSTKYYFSQKYSLTIYFVVILFRVCVCVFMYCPIYRVLNSALSFLPFTCPSSEHPT